jgi:hypothetical protein
MLSRAAAAAAAAGGGLGLAPAGAAATAVVDAGVAAPDWMGGVLARGLLFLAAPLLLLLLTIKEGDEVGLVPLLLLLPGMLLAGVGGALLEPPLVVLLFPAGCWSLSESASSEATDTVLFDFCLMLHRVCTRDEDLHEKSKQQQKQAVRLVRGLQLLLLLCRWLASICRPWKLMKVADK